MIKQILNKNILDLVRIPVFVMFIALQLLLFVFVLLNQIPHLVLGYAFKFNVILIYFLSAYLSAKFLFDLKKSNAFAFLFMKPISKASFTISSIVSLLLAMLIPVMILLASVFVANQYLEPAIKFTADIILDSDKTMIREISKELQLHKNNQSFDETYKEVLLYKATVFPKKTGRWTFNIPKKLNNKNFSVVYNTFFNTRNRDNTNSEWKVFLDTEEVFNEPYIPNNLPSGVLEPSVRHLSDVITVEFINNSKHIPIMFVPKEPVNLLFNGGSFYINLLKGGIKISMNVLLVISVSFMLSIFMSLPGVFFSAYLSIISCMLYKLFYLNKSSSMFKRSVFGNGFNEMLSSQYIRVNQLVLFGVLVVVFVWLVTKFSEYQLQSDSFYLDHK
jgi:hypothetical protein